ncbi:hypothetical protein NW801_10545 [Brevibacillus laterosporus]|uniref:Uncharacterized protein n=1 Tax=Brevibacillus halotolerans TaxID=1507437 RepID=A0ABT4HXI2_9BACL|nr:MULTISPECIES: hypothetical protein [Brevibacillus]MCR8985483.1 hypothetical protein [Brevibacillus laterosporus]MCZ0831216.1 hypothetical protein [Brevibacillus halotolerans]
MKRKFIAAALVTGTLLSYSSNTFADVNSKGAISKMSEVQNQNFIVGTVIDAYKGEISVEYNTNEGKSEMVVVKTNNGQTFAEGDKVQVSNKSEWKIKNPGHPINEFYQAPGNSISKVDEKQNQNFIVGTVIDAYKGEISVEYNTNEGKSEIVVVKTNNGQTFAEGDKVQVSNKSEWKIKNPGHPMYEFYQAPGNSISKVDATN